MNKKSYNINMNSLHGMKWIKGKNMNSSKLLMKIIIIRLNSCINYCPDFNIRAHPTVTSCHICLSLKSARNYSFWWDKSPAKIGVAKVIYVARISQGNVIPIWLSLTSVSKTDIFFGVKNHSCSFIPLVMDSTFA